MSAVQVVRTVELLIYAAMMTHIIWMVVDVFRECRCKQCTRLKALRKTLEGIADDDR